MERREAIASVIYLCLHRFSVRWSGTIGRVMSQFMTEKYLWMEIYMQPESVDLVSHVKEYAIHRRYVPEECWWMVVNNRHWATSTFKQPATDCFIRIGWVVVESVIVKMKHVCYSRIVSVVLLLRFRNWGYLMNWWPLLRSYVYKYVFDFICSCAGTIR